jgi:hypothetical protein
LSAHLGFVLPTGLFWLSHQYSICIPLLPHSCYMSRRSHPSDLIVLIILGEEYKF